MHQLGLRPASHHPLPTGPPLGQDTGGGPDLPPVPLQTQDVVEDTGHILKEK